ncbi:hypothetical protein E2C01_090188 [Portunus trituberculatus]|uniref:Uncharacterized protein n=1 Tax=Portunus trituberculatus TaxID=210409 RepID=A0A5B7JL62_PORTR|nr:hypothetical protein [Portunus trituberculatus]
MSVASVRLSASCERYYVDAPIHDNPPSLPPSFPFPHDTRYHGAAEGEVLRWGGGGGGGGVSAWRQAKMCNVINIVATTCPAAPLCLPPTT